MKKLIVMIGISFLAVSILTRAEAGLTLYEDEHWFAGVQDATAWLGWDFLNSETVGGLKSSVLKYKLPMNMSVNLDAGILGTEIDAMDKIDGMVGVSVTLPTPKEWKGHVFLDAGIAYSPDWITPPDRFLFYGGVKLTY